MNRPAQVSQIAKTRAALGLFQPSPSHVNVARWKINGHRASVVVWTAEEWEQLTERPTDAQYYPCGIWCALRVE